MIVVPVNPLSASWAASYYALKQEVIARRAELAHVLSLTTFLGQPQSEDPAHILAFLNGVLLYAEVEKDDPRLAEIVQVVREVMPYVGLEEELAAVTPEPNFGVFSGSLSTIGVQVANPSETTLALSRAIRQSRTGSSGFPCVRAGSLADETPVILVAMGAQDDSSGKSIFPLGRGRDQTRSAAAIALGLATQLWDAQADGWIPGKFLGIGLPGASDEAIDKSESTAFSGFVAPKRVMYSNGDSRLVLEYGSNDFRVHGLLMHKGDSYPLVMARMPSQEIKYAGRVGRNEAGFDFQGTKLKLNLGHESILFNPVGLPQLVYQGTDQLLAPPEIVPWLAQGIQTLEKDVSSGVVANVSRETLVRMSAKIKELPIQLVGSLTGLDNSPRILIDQFFYGSPADERSLESQRASKRRSIAGPQLVRKKVGTATITYEKYPPSFAYLKFLAEEAASDPKKVGAAKNRIEAIDRFMSEYTMTQMTSIEDVRERKRLESKMWKDGEAVRPPPRSIPLVGNQSPLVSTVLTVWGLRGDLDYGVVWQSPVLSAAQVEELIERSEVKQHALYFWVLAQADLIAKAEAFGETGPAIPYAIVQTTLVSIPKTEKLKMSLPKPYPLGVASARGTREPVGLYLSAWRIPLQVTEDQKRTTIPEGKTGPDTLGIVPANLPMASVLPVALTLGRVFWDLSNKSLGLMEGKDSLFSLGTLEQTKEYQRIFERLSKKEDVETDPAELAWTMLLAEGVVPYYGPTGMPDIIFGGRRAQAVFGGAGSQAKRIGQSQTSEGWSSGRLVSPDPQASRWATRKPSMYRDIIGFASSILKQVGFTQKGERRTKKAEEPPSPEDILSMMGQYGIIIEDPTNPSQVKEALVRLKQALMVPVQQPVSVGRLPEWEHNSEFSHEYLDEMAKLNPRRARKIRKNPLQDYEVERAAEYLESKKKERDPGDLPGALRRVRDSARSAVYTPERVKALLPRTSEGRDTWSPKTRLKALSQHDLVSRVGMSDRNADIVKKGRAQSIAREMPIDDPEVMALVLEEAGLSLDVVGQILEAQRGSTKTIKTRKGKVQYSIQPSTAICKAWKKRRLAGYTLPEAILTAGDPRNHKVIIMLSPQQAAVPRVMTWRRGVHLDCDLVGSTPEDLPELLGRALQSAMLWLVERSEVSAESNRNRMNRTDILVGRVGQPFVYVAYHAGETVSLGQIESNIRRAQSGEESYKVPLYTSERERVAQTERDVANYMNAAQSSRNVTRQPERAIVEGPSRSEEKHVTESPDEEPLF